MTQRAHNIRIRASTPEIVTVGEEFEVTYFLANRSANLFPGGKFVITRSWSSIPNLVVNDPINVPKIPASEEVPIQGRSVTPITDGYTLFLVTLHNASDGKPIQIRLPNGARISAQQPFHSVRARTHEEISQKQAVWCAVIGLILVPITQVIDWFIGFYYGI